MELYRSEFEEADDGDATGEVELTVNVEATPLDVPVDRELPVKECWTALAIAGGRTSATTSACACRYGKYPSTHSRIVNPSDLCIHHNSPRVRIRIHDTMRLHGYHRLVFAVYMCNLSSMVTKYHYRNYD